MGAALVFFRDGFAILPVAFDVGAGGVFGDAAFTRFQQRRHEVDGLGADGARIRADTGLPGIALKQAQGGTGNVLRDAKTGAV